MGFINSAGFVFNIENNFIALQGILSHLQRGTALSGGNIVFIIQFHVIGIENGAAINYIHFTLSMVYVANIVVGHAVRFNVRGIAIIFYFNSRSSGSGVNIVFIIYPCIFGIGSRTFINYGHFSLNTGYIGKIIAVHAVRFNIHRIVIIFSFRSRSSGAGNKNYYRNQKGNS